MRTTLRASLNRTLEFALACTFPVLILTLCIAGLSTVHSVGDMLEILLWLVVIVLVYWANA